MYNMDLELITFYFTNYGAIAIFVIVLLEYLNLPGFPAGVIMPLSGVMAAYTKRFPKQKETIERNLEWIHRKGCIGVFLAKLIPMIRTIISIPAGVVQMNLTKYILSSMLGIIIWNLVFVGAGYLLGEQVFTMLAQK